MSAPPEFTSTGHCHLPSPFPADTIARLREALSGWRGNAPEPENAYGILHNNLWRTLPAFQQALLGGPLGNIAATLLGKPVVLFQDNLIWKPPGTAGSVQWHQDYAYWPLSSPDGVTFWLALDDADEENGCLRYIPGSHRLGERQPANFIAPGSASWKTELPPLNWQQRQHSAVAAPAQAGTLLAHHPLTWHMSPPNASSRQRRAWSLSFIGADVRWDTTHAPHPFSYFLKPTDGTLPRGEMFPQFG